ncbi:hypothetical protein [Streptomyces sp. NPDC001851]|uniref:hypothetical protein n=1 Tax=Streptomyces sp. NPDC001851 TaxID=3154529 RepID=UPI00331EF743
MEDGVTRFRRYALNGVFTRALQQIQAQADAAGDIDWLVQIDSTVVRPPARRRYPPKSRQHRIGDVRRPVSVRSRVLVTVVAVMCQVWASVACL